MAHTFSTVLLTAGMLALAQFSHANAPLLNPPSPAAITEGQTIVAAMRANPRGPYDAIRWFCNDGSILPPKAYACTQLGGGKQHAFFSAQRTRLAQLGWRVGTIYASFDELSPEQTAAARPYLRLRELPLEKYLLDIDDGWVLHKARGYRGRVQIEDEQKAGLDILLSLLKDKDWKTEYFILTRELVRTIPHSHDSVDPTRNIRRQSQLLAELDKSFEPLRAEIHGQPSRATGVRIRQWMAGKSASSAQILALAEELAAEMEDLYSVKGSAIRLQSLADAQQKYDPAIADTIKNASLTRDSVQRLSLLANAITALRTALNDSSNAKVNLQRLNLMTELEAELLAVSRIAPAPLTREDALRRAAQLLRATQDFGWLSANEYLALSEPIANILLNSDSLSAEHYRKLIRRLQLAPAWAQASIRHTFAEALTAYAALDLRASQFVDDLLRGSALMPLAETTHLLLLDSGRITGKTSSLFGKPQESVWGLNPGTAKGRLRVLSASEALDSHRFDPADIVVIPNTTSSLFPAAGIVTIGEGNPLSHIQILARNLGIPNIVIEESLLPLMQQNDGAMVELAAASDGRVLLRLTENSDLPTAAGKEPARHDASDAEKVLAPVPDLSVTKPLPLAALNAGLSGRVVGPKAANVGELARIFPDRVAPAVALPFGVFALHTGSGDNAPRLRVQQAFEKLHTGELNEEAFLTELDKARDTLAAVKLQPDTTQLLTAAMQQEFGSVGEVGVFVRSDTNMEDLPQFTGAGLNETLPNVIGFDNQLAAISRVWSSVYSRRAMAWRSRILKNPDAVFSSVLLMKSVASDKSGVLVTTDLTNDSGTGFTVSLSWGVGGAVDNESAASYLLKPDGQDVLLSEAKAPYQRYLKPEGGVGWRAAAAGSILNRQETGELRALARDVIEIYPPSYDTAGQPLPWDIEFAFAEGKLMLLQIRPLVQRGALEAETIVSSIIPPRSPNGVIQLGDSLSE
jgi:hypothetical protein